MHVSRHEQLDQEGLQRMSNAREVSYRGRAPENLRTERDGDHQHQTNRQKRHVDYIMSVDNRTIETYNRSQSMSTVKLLETRFGSV